MKKYKSVQETPVFEQSHQLTLEIYKVTSLFPRSEVFGLSSQLRRSSSSIPANISEGYGRRTAKDIAQFMYNARGSYEEVNYHLLLAKDLGFIDSKVYLELRERYADVGRQLNGLIKSLNSRVNS